MANLKNNESEESFGDDSSRECCVWSAESEESFGDDSSRECCVIMRLNLESLSNYLLQSG